MFKYEASIEIEKAIIEAVTNDIEGATGEAVPDKLTITLTRDFGAVDSSNPYHAFMSAVVEIDHPDAVTLAEIGSCLGN